METHTKLLNDVLATYMRVVNPDFDRSTINDSDSGFKDEGAVLKAIKESPDFMPKRLNELLESAASLKGLSHILSPNTEYIIVWSPTKQMFEVQKE